MESDNQQISVNTISPSRGGEQPNINDQLPKPVKIIGPWDDPAHHW